MCQPSIIFKTSKGENRVQADPFDVLSLVSFNEELKGTFQSFHEMYYILAQNKNFPCLEKWLSFCVLPVNREKGNRDHGGANESDVDRW